MNGSVIGAGSMVGAGALITKDRKVPEKSVMLGAPARLARLMSDEEVRDMQGTSAHYIQRSAMFRTDLEKIG
jgi:carbonic anhydrase/acetyltransferase-like protein (isoleucine patch superfamily)